jgi:epsilon-lactone hydrolase
MPRKVPRIAHGKFRIWINYTILKILMRLYGRRMDARRYLRVRKDFERLIVKHVRLPEDCITTPVDVSGTPAEWVETRGTNAARTIMYLHGGGYVFGSPMTHRGMIWRISRVSGARALSLDYRLAPEHPHPAALDDAVSAYRWLLDIGTGPGRIAVIGDSAGGGLTLALLQTLRDRGIPLPACAVCLSPWADLSCSGETHRTNKRKDPVLPAQAMPGFARLYCPDDDPANPAVSPLFGDFANLPPLLIHAGTEEILLDDARRVAEKASKTGTTVELKIWPGMIHVFQSLALMLPEARQAHREIGDFIQRHIP